MKKTNAPRKPLLPAEKQVIGWSVGLVTVLLAMFYFLNAFFFSSGQ